MSAFSMNGTDGETEKFRFTCVECGGEAKLHIQQSSIQGYHECSVYLTCRECDQEETIPD